MTADDPSPAEPAPEPALLALAREKFGALSRAEEELFRAAQEGRPASALTDNEEEGDLANAKNWGPDRVVRAECISWVSTDPHAAALLSYRGLEFFGMRVEGELNLDKAEIKFPFVAWKCAFSEHVSLQDARLRSFYLVDCRIKSLNVSRTTIEGSVLLRYSEAEGEVNLIGTTIGGDLVCSGARFLNADSLAFTANAGKIDGVVFLDDVTATAEVNLLGARIGGSLICNGAQLSNASGSALSAGEAQIGGAVLLRKVYAQGQINLAAATIEGSLDCDGARISNPKEVALEAGAVEIRGSVYLRTFEADGEVNLAGAKIGRNLECGGAHLSSASGLVLEASVATIGNNLFLDQGFRAAGQVYLVGATVPNLLIRNIVVEEQTSFSLRLAKVGTLWDDELSWPKAENLALDGFHYDRLHESSPFEADKRKKWLRLQPRDKFRPQPYEQLAAVLRQMGHGPDARQIMIEKNRDRARHTRRFSPEWWWYNLFGRLIGYGYRPGRAFRISLAMILLGTFLFQLGFAWDVVSPTRENAYAKASNGQVILEEKGRPKISENYPVFNAFFYSLESFTPLLKLDQSANWTPNASRSAEISSGHFKVPFSGNFLRYYLYFHIAAGWLLTSLWVGAITGLVKT
jgi:hypothetical protein